jgi:ubiquinone/menaquinone biosynthesis C-methylase UbiE
MSNLKNPRDIRNFYNSISGTYERRYELNPLNGTAKALCHLVAEIGARRVLEIGCGTGHWLKTLAPYVERIVGLDSSSGMLLQARSSTSSIELVCGSANFLPFAENSFEVVFVVNALHHFDEKRQFVQKVRNLLKADGALALIGMDVTSALGNWIIYDYFPGALEYDQSRFPPWEQVRSWMQAAGYTVLPLRTVELLKYEKRGRAILDDHFIQRHGSSQFMGLTDAQYQTGIDRIKSVIAEAEARGEEAVFKSELQLKMAVGRVQK